ncbi:transcription factor HES-4-A-like isoform X1 [Cynoglossus semilaevis]|uniref:Transcription factor HES-4-A-like n=1 Tax=Cynoglossus semilaevis TaxID=244447 RepID=A0A3P8WBV3_CYNSE|nr:transcription factor HES-4-A-like isoform X2 [Cynoglossus semilaevis]XP_024917474.1 transcription factor HES-4-A-like isoform X1 [Cynoglossus semilaevis]
MKLLQETEEATRDRKVIKSQVEKRRRERMNASLERLRSMLLQEPQHLSGAQGRVEKAEILEHTVLFLQRTIQGDKSTTGGGEKQSFQDGFSACFQRAAHFLGSQGKDLWMGASLDASCVSARFPQPDSDSTVHRGLNRNDTSCSLSPGSLMRTKSILRMLRQKSDHRLGMAQTFSANTSPHPYRHPIQQSFSIVSSPPQKQKCRRAGVEREGSKQALGQASSLNQTLWRPWP